MSVKGRDLAAKRAWFMGQLRPRRRRWRRQRAAGRGSGWRCAPGRPIKAGADGSAPRSCLLRRRSGAAGFPAPVSPPHLFKIFILTPPQLWGAAAARRVRRGKMARSGARPPRLLLLLLLSLVLPAAAERSPGPGPSPGPAGEARSGAGGRAPGCAAQAGSCRGYGLIV